MKLKPCPFCGSIKSVRITPIENGAMRNICCANAFCMFQPSAIFDTKQEALDTWNTREGDE